MGYQARSGKPDKNRQVWRCNECKNIKKKEKPGASEGCAAVLYCKHCGEREVHKMVDTEDDGGIPNAKCRI